MSTADPARDIKDALAGWWSGQAFPAGNLTLNVDDDFTPTAAGPALLVADDGGPRVLPGAWLLPTRSFRRITMRLTAFATGRTQARALVDAAATELVSGKPAGIARIEDISAPLVTRDRDTGAWLASVTMPVIVKPV